MDGSTVFALGRVVKKPPPNEEDDAPPVGCGPSCSLSHNAHGNCLVCNRPWGKHSGHGCQSPFSGRRGSWCTDGRAHGPRIAPWRPGDLVLRLPKGFRPAAKVVLPVLCTAAPPWPIAE